MITFETKKHVEIDKNFQGINLTEFAFWVDQPMDTEQIVATFIQSTQFSFDSLHDCVKADPEKGYLRRAFNVDRIKITDFKKTNKQGVAKFLLDFISAHDWGDDRNDFANLLDRYFEIHHGFTGSDYFIISKDWFDKDNEIIVDPEYHIYGYYFLIVSVDRNSNTLTLSEWTYD